MTTRYPVSLRFTLAVSVAVVVRPSLIPRERLGLVRVRAGGCRKETAAYACVYLAMIAKLKNSLTSIVRKMKLYKILSYV